MCGIIGAVSNRDVVPVLVDGLQRLEYRGYDSSGIAAVDAKQNLRSVRRPGKVKDLAEALHNGHNIQASTAIAHTRWATHGDVTENNAHPLVCNDTVAVVCNGIIENYKKLRERQLREGYPYRSETDTEAIAVELYRHLERGASLLDAMKQTVERLEGYFAVAAVTPSEPNRVVIAKHGCPLLIGYGENETFIASDILALVDVADSFSILDDGDIAEVTTGLQVRIFDQSDARVDRAHHAVMISAEEVSLAPYKYYLQKEIHEQGAAVCATLNDRISESRLLEEETFGTDAKEIFDRTQAVRILACGTSYHAALVAKAWMEAFGIPCEAEIASEFCYRTPAVLDDTLVVAISQSGETYDTRVAVERAKSLGMTDSIAICNSPASTLTRMTELVLLTHAGPEISVASSKAFTTQLVNLLMLTVALARRRNLSASTEAQIISELRELPLGIEKMLNLEPQVIKFAEQFADKEHALFLGRGTHYPIAKEGALKLKEISYIHAEAYPAGELKHGPLALVDANMPTVAVAPNNHLLTRLKTDIEEVRARKGQLFVFSDINAEMQGDKLIQVLEMPSLGEFTAPIAHVVPLQLLAYHVAVMRGTDVDQPRNLAKSVTV